jgi:hypothetical protein
MRNVLFLALIAAMAGCASSHQVTYPEWQHGVEKYVHDFGKGDPTTLRDMKIPDGRRGFALLGDPLPNNSTDAVGVLLAHRPIDGRPSFIYLVGLVDKEQVSDIRLAVLAIDNGQFRWHLSPANASSLQAYRKFKETLWRQRFPGRSAAPAEYLNFPGPDDVFTVEEGTDRVRAVHQASGAVWMLAISGHGGSQRSAMAN